MVLRSPSLAVLLLAASSGLAQDCLWRPMSAPIPPGSLVYDGVNHRVLSVLGNGVINAWSGTAWTTVPTVGSPSHGGPLTFDSIRGRIVQHAGGAFPQVFNDTWEWDGLNWIQVSQSGPQGPGFIVFDAARNRTVFFHELNPGSPGLTWTWDGATWVQASSKGPPSNPHSIVYDNDEQRVLLFARIGSRISVWAWDGVSWTRRPDAPAEFNGGLAVYDPGRRRVMLHGGSINPNTPDIQTWEYSPSSGVWERRSVAGPASGSMVFDVARGRAMLTPSWEWNGNGVTTPVYIVTHPSAQQVYPGTPVEFTVVAASNTSPSYQWFKDNSPLANIGNITGALSPTLRINPVGIADLGSYSVLVRTACNEVRSTSAALFVAGGPCYANCDQSTSLPLLTANDFVCFSNAFARGDLYANCDGSTGTPVLTGEDWVCFIIRYSGGC